MDNYNIFNGHTYLGSPLGGLHTYQLTFFLGFCIRYIVVALPTKTPYK
jgi:hypothetical protein